MKKIISRSLGFLAVTTLAASLAACSTGGEDNALSADGAGSSGFAQDSNTLVMGIVPDQASVENNFQPLVDFIAEKTGKEVKVIESANYAALVEAAIAGKIDIGTFSGFTYVAATNGGAKLTPVGVQITKKGEEPGYESLAIVPKDSKITSIADMKNKKVCFVDPGSTSGYLYPSYELLEAKIDPETDVTPVFAGGHDASAQKTAQGVECEAGFAEDAVVETTGVKEGLFKEGDLKVINRTTIPGAPIVMSTTLPQDVQDTITESLNNITVEDIKDAGITVTDSFRAYFYQMVPVEDSYYDTIRDICDVTKAKQCTPAA